ncbi:MAG: hypothetical protein K0U78_20840 [Actinomycetia bacterium]|nr:hypothetical protein [Actinomycetes bacterium]
MDLSVDCPTDTFRGSPRCSPDDTTGRMPPGRIFVVLRVTDAARGYPDP